MRRHTLSRYVSVLCHLNSYSGGLKNFAIGGLHSLYWLWTGENWKPLSAVLLWKFFFFCTGIHRTLKYDNFRLYCLAHVVKKVGIGYGHNDCIECSLSILKLPEIKSQLFCMFLVFKTRHIDFWTNLSKFLMPAVPGMSISKNHCG